MLIRNFITDFYDIYINLNFIVNFREPEGIIALCHPLPVLVQGHVDEIHRMIQKARQKPLVEVSTY